VTSAWRACRSESVDSAPVRGKEQAPRSDPGCRKKSGVSLGSLAKELRGDVTGNRHEITDPCGLRAAVCL